MLIHITSTKRQEPSKDGIFTVFVRTIGTYGDADNVRVNITVIGKPLVLFVSAYGGLQ